VGKTNGRRPPGRPRRRWEDILKMDLLGCGTASLGVSFPTFRDNVIVSSLRVDKKLAKFCSSARLNEKVSSDAYANASLFLPACQLLDTGKVCTAQHF
jgi:hypothetical protein